jgi:hypothetical protein
VESIAKFKTELRKQKDIRQVPKHYEIGPRKLNIALTQLRCFASFLNYDLFQVNTVFTKNFSDHKPTGPVNHHKPKFYFAGPKKIRNFSNLGASLCVILLALFFLLFQTLFIPLATHIVDT